MKPPEAAIHFFSEGIEFQLSQVKKIKAWIKSCLDQEGKNLGVLNYIFCQDDYLLHLNQKHLNHNSLTDIITFNYVENNCISADIFISIERVKENAIALDQAFEIELSRVIIHGILHLIGYNDHSREEKEEIRAKEDFYLALLFEN